LDGLLAASEAKVSSLNTSSSTSSISASNPPLPSNSNPPPISTSTLSLSSLTAGPSASPILSSGIQSALPTPLPSPDASVMILSSTAFSAIPTHLPHSSPLIHSPSTSSWAAPPTSSFTRVLSTLSHLKKGKHLHSRSISLLVVFSAHLSYPVTDKEALNRLLTLLETVTTSTDGAIEPAALVTLRAACISGIKRLGGVLSSFLFESVMERIILPALKSVNSIVYFPFSRSNISFCVSHNTYQSPYHRALFHKIAADILRIGIETECITRQSAATYFEKCISTLKPSQKSIDRTINSVSKIMTKSSTPNSNYDQILSHLFHSKEERGGGGGGYIQPIAAVWTRPDFEIPRELYISIAATYLSPTPNAPLSSNFDWARVGLSTLATTPSTTLSLIPSVSPPLGSSGSGGGNGSGGGQPFSFPSSSSTGMFNYTGGSQLSPLISGPALSPQMSPLGGLSGTPN
jgi:hypothetical protein